MKVVLAKYYKDWDAADGPKLPIEKIAAYAYLKEAKPWVYKPPPVVNNLFHIISHQSESSCSVHIIAPEFQKLGVDHWDKCATSHDHEATGIVEAPGYNQLRSS